jgi:hypothetical protein
VNRIRERLGGSRTERGGSGHHTHLTYHTMHTFLIHYAMTQTVLFTP